jgi:hypothetical protein
LNTGIKSTHWSNNFGFNQEFLTKLISIIGPESIKTIGDVTVLISSVKNVIETHNFAKGAEYIRNTLYKLLKTTSFFEK